MKIGAFSASSVKQMSSHGRRIWILGFAALCGILLGAALSAGCGDEALGALSDYLRGYSALSASSREGALPGVAAAYLRVPLLLGLVSFCGAGMVLIPLLLCWEGAGLSFAAVAFSRAMGRQGLALALAALGIRGLIVLPCALYLGGVGWRLAYERKGLSALTAGDIRGSLLCFALLMTGAALEVSLTPGLMALALQG